MSNKKERITSQKKLIMDYLESTDKHPSAAEIYKVVRRKLPRISKGTVYRILNNLKEKGEIQEISTDVSRYESDTSSHAHFICSNCGEIFDGLDISSDFKRILQKNKSKMPGSVERYHIYLYGVCKNCKR